MAVIGRLAISLGLNTAELRTDLKKSRRSIKRFSNRIKRSFRNLRRSVLSAINPFSKLKLAIIGIAGPAALGFLIKSSLDSIDALGKVSDKLGIATERLVGMRLAAELTGVGAKTLDMAIQRMTRRISEAAMGTGEAKNAIKELGLSAQDLANSTPDQAFIKISEAMKQVENQSDRVRLSFKLFDSEGVALVNTLRLGREGLEAIQVEAEQLGLTMSRDAVKGVEETNDSITRLMTLFRGLSNQITAALSPAINLAVTSFKDFILETAASEGGIKKFAQNMAIDILGGIQSVLSGFGSMFDIIEKVKFALIDIGAIDDTELLRAEKLHASILQKVGLVAGARKAGLGTLETTVRLQKEAKSELDEIRIIQESISNRGKDGLSVIDKSVSSLGKMIAKTKELRNATAQPSTTSTVADAAQTTGVTPEIRQSLETRVEMIRASLLTKTQIENESFARDLALLEKANTNKVGSISANNTIIEDLEASHKLKLASLDVDDGAILRAQLADKIAVIEASQQTEIEKLGELLEARTFMVEDAFQNEVISFQRRGELLASIEKTHQDNITAIDKAGWTERQKFAAKTTQQQTGQVLGELANLTQGIARSSRTAFRINKAASIGIATINAIEGASTVLKTYAANPPLAAALSAAHYVAGIARVNAIRSTSFGGGSGGGGGARGAVSGIPSQATTAPAVVAAIPQNQQGAGETIININVNGSVLAEDLPQLIADSLKTANDFDKVQITVRGERAEVA